MKKDSRAVRSNETPAAGPSNGRGLYPDGGLELADAEVRSERDVGELGGLAGGYAVGTRVRRA
jgi:hypothetical protein